MPIGILATVWFGYIVAENLGINRDNVLQLQGWVWFALIPAGAVLGALGGWWLYGRKAAERAVDSLSTRKRIAVSMSLGAGVALVVWYSAGLVADRVAGSSVSIGAEVVGVQRAPSRSWSNCTLYVSLRLESGTISRNCARRRSDDNLWLGAAGPHAGQSVVAHSRKNVLGIVVDGIELQRPPDAARLE